MLEPGINPSIESSHAENLFKEVFEIIKKHNENSNNIVDYQALSNMDVPLSCFYQDKHLYDEVKESYKTWVASKEFSYNRPMLQDMDKVYATLSDEESRVTFDWYIRFKVAFILTCYADLVEKLFPYPSGNKLFYAKLAKQSIKQNNHVFTIDGYEIDSTFGSIQENWINQSYLLEGKCEPGDKDVIIDGGAYKGESTLWFAKRTGNEGKVYAFEIVQSHIETIKENIKRNKLEKVVEVIDKGLWDTNTCIDIIQDGASSQCNWNGEKKTICVTAVDTFVKENNIEKIDFIKMDVEGAELLALKGAANTIRQYKPKLAICVYHKYCDIVQIPMAVKALVPEYKLYLSHKVHFPYATVLFASI